MSTATPTTNPTLNKNKKFKNSMIKYGVKINYSNNWKPLEISYNDINNYDFSKGFLECHKDLEFVHLYFDFDNISSEAEYKDIINYLDTLKVVFGDYSIGGYTNNIDFSNNLGFKYIENAKKIISFHVIFYTTAISVEDLIDIMIFDNKKNPQKYIVNSVCDKSIYRINKRRMFRHVLSDKIFAANNPNNTITAGNILNNLTPDTQIVQIRGDEPIITKDKWLIVFPQIKPLENNTEEDLLSIDEMMKLINNMKFNNYDDSNVNNHELFEVLYKGFDDIIIHNDCNTDINTEISIMPVVKSFKWFEVNNIISREELLNALEYIKTHAKLSENLKANWDNQINRYIDKHNKNYGPLLKILKVYKPEYYDKYVKPIITKVTIKNTCKEDFLTSKYTFTDYLNDAYKYNTIDDYINNLTKCFAFINNGQYILKEWNNDHVVFNIKSSKKELLETIGSITINVDTTQQEKEQMKKQHKKVSDTKNIKLIKLLDDIKNIRPKFKSFNKYDILGDDINIFGLFRPPTQELSYINISINQDLVDTWLNIIKDQLYDEESIKAFNHLLYVNAYLLQYHKKAPVFFVKYSETGNTGKNYIDNSFEKLYKEYALVGIGEQTLLEKHNGGLANKLYRSYDEFSTDNYKTKIMDNIVKRLTNNKLAVRAMCKDTKQESDYAIDMLNTNHPDLYGMLNSNDKALLSRLCIIRLKERDIKESVYYKNISIIDNPSFPISLYNYLMNIDLTDFINKGLYDRYNSDIVQNQLKSIKGSILDDFIEYIEANWEEGTYKGKPIEYITLSNMRDLYSKYAGYKKLNNTNFDKELEKFGIYKIQLKLYLKPVRVFYKEASDEIKEKHEFYEEIYNNKSVEDKDED